MIARRRLPEERDRLLLPQDPVRPLVPYVVTISFGGRETTHRSVASSWALAVDLAMRAVRRGEIASLDAIPSSIRVDRG